MHRAAMSTEQTYDNSVSIAVTTAGGDEAVRARAQALADELRLLYLPGGAAYLDRRRRTGNAGPRTCLRDPDVDLLHGAVPDFLLVVRENRLELCETRRSGAGPIFVDFTARWSGTGHKLGLSHRQPIAKAVGLRRGPVSVVDATAGLARDSFLLASLGCKVTAVERSAVLGALIRDGLTRAATAAPPGIPSVLDRITLIVDNARNVLVEMKSAAPDVVYLDPMYPPKRKKALSKKEMRVCRRLVGDDADAGELLAIARQVARRRVVVKRHPHAPTLAADPAIQFRSKKARYDVYLALA